tara:strand:- start:40 stop:360 length:321 start_codon:yes stop_codon:yes gene_type:complete
MKEKQKRIIFNDTTARHAQLKIRLERDGLTQAEFFRSYITAYLEKDREVLDFIKMYKERKGIQTKRTRKIIDEEDQLQNDTMAKFGIKDEELENIFDLIAEEHPDL